MTLITQIEDKGAVVAWSPVGEYADVIALGTKVSSYNLLFLYFQDSMCHFLYNIHLIKYKLLTCDTDPKNNNILSITNISTTNNNSLQSK
jgi:hypothetical protein